MANFDKGVFYYTKGVASIEVAFPEDDVKCRWCKYLRSDKDNKRHFCRLTDEMIYSIEMLSGSCPLKFINEEGEVL